jgi:transcriptional regulator with XRE-family HTH domain
MPRVMGRPLPAVGQRIRAWRMQRGLTQQQLAQALGVSESYIQHVEQGQRSLRVDKLLELAAALNVSAPQLLEDDATGDDPSASADTPEPTQTLLNELHLPAHAAGYELAVALARYMAAREATELERIRQEQETARERIRYVEARRADAEYLAQANISWAMGRDPKRLPHRAGHGDAAGVAAPG